MQVNSDDINKMYEQILMPTEFIKEFKNIDEFREWAMDGTILDLKEAISVFQDYELYEHCAVMQKLIDDLI